MTGSKNRWPLIGCLFLVAILAVKYYWSFFQYPGVPFGYDAGIYRFLFLTHGKGWPPFYLTAMPEWAKGHPLGLFFFSSLLLKLGLPVDFLIGWVWNLFPVLVGCILAWIVFKSYGKAEAFAVLLVAIVSVVQYQGFLMMYWKVFAALLWCVLAFWMFEKKSWLWIFFGMLSIATHQQIGLLFGAAIFSSIAVSVLIKREVAQAYKAGAGLFASGLLGFLWYLPVYERSIGDILPLLARPAVSLGILAIFCFGILMMISVQISPLPRYWLMLVCAVLGFVLLLLPFAGYAPATLIDFLTRNRSSDPGAFFTVQEYLKLSLPILILGVTGLALLIRRNPESPWIWAAVWSALAVLSMFFFYRRFLLTLDFFLILPAAVAAVWLWQRRLVWLRFSVVAVFLIQGGLMIKTMSELDPHVEAKSLNEFSNLAPVVEPAAKFIVLDNMAPWVVGFLPDLEVSGPGIFNSQPLEAWQKFLFGSHEDRVAFISLYPVGTYFYATDVFRTFYPPEVQTLLKDSCLKPVGPKGLYLSVCGKKEAQRID